MQIEKLQERTEKIEGKKKNNKRRVVGQWGRNKMHSKRPKVNIQEMDLQSFCKTLYIQLF